MTNMNKFILYTILMIIIILGNFIYQGYIAKLRIFEVDPKSYYIEIYYPYKSFVNSQELIRPAYYNNNKTGTLIRPENLSLVSDSEINNLEAVFPFNISFQDKTCKKLDYNDSTGISAKAVVFLDYKMFFENYRMGLFNIRMNYSKEELNEFVKKYCSSEMNVIDNNFRLTPYRTQ